MNTNTLRFALLSGILILSFALFGGCNKDGPATAPSATENSSLALEKGTPPANPAIAFFNAGTVKLDVMNGDGTNLREVLPLPNLFPRPSWSPDGRSIAMNYHPTSGPGGIYIVDISVVSGVPRASNLRFLVGARDPQPSWSPGAAGIAYSGYPGSQILVIPTTGGTPTVLYTVSSSDSSYIVWTSWNPNGTQLAFVETFLHGSNYVNQCYIKVLDRATCAVRTVAIAAPNVWINKPDWARHSDALAYFAYEGNTSKIYTLNLVTGSATYIVTGYYPSWSPDDTKLVYNYGGYVRTVNVATKVTKVLAADNGLQAQANWRRF